MLVTKAKLSCSLVGKKGHVILHFSESSLAGESKQSVKAAFFFFPRTACDSPYMDRVQGS